MGHGLYEYKETDNVFKMVFPYQLAISGLFTLAFYQFAKSARLFNSPTVLRNSLPISFLVGLYYSKGFALQYLAAQKACERNSWERHDRYLNYRNELRNKKLID
jgi:CCR4-NOT transcriptional regulation complex NOT5 subunit